MSSTLLDLSNSSPLSNIRILLIDDDEEDFLLTRDIVEEIEHFAMKIDWVDNYETAMQTILADRHDVYLVDYRLGARDGLTLIQEALTAGCQAPMILLTGQDDLEVDAKAMKIGAADYLVKSQISADLLDRSIRYSIKQAKTLRQIQHMNQELEHRVQERTKDLERVVDELQTSEQLYSSIANQFPFGVIMILDRNMEFVLLDGQDVRHFTLNQDELLGKKAYELVTKEKQPIMEYYLRRVREGEQLTFDFEIGAHTYGFRGTPLTDRHGDIDKILVVAINITQQKEVERNYKNALAKEKQLNELKSRFISMASHEFRTPLSTILTSVSLINRYQSSEEQPKRDKHIKRIKSNVSNLTGILDDFLSLSKLEEGKVIVTPVRFNLKNFLQELTEEMYGVAKSGQQIMVEYTGDHVVCLDRRLLKNVLINLISNATKYSAPGGPITVNTDISDPYIRISVRDEGIGIPEEEQIHLFERFYRAHNATNIQGTGLGLHIVRKYVSLMEGRVEFESMLSEGTTFTLTFPRIHQPAATTSG